MSKPLHSGRCAACAQARPRRPAAFLPCVFPVVVPSSNDGEIL